VLTTFQSIAATHKSCSIILLTSWQQVGDYH